MIHLIYIYFIINAFLAGLTVGNKEGVLTLFIAVFFGSPFYGIILLYTSIEQFVKWLNRILLIRAWYRLFLTSYFKNLNEMTIKIRTQQYKGIRLDKTNMNRYERYFYRKLDKKYNYGITK